MKTTRIARIKLSLFDDIDIYDILLAYILMEMSDKLYIYIDDRTYHKTYHKTYYKTCYKTYQNYYTTSITNIIESKLTVLKRFGIKYDSIIKYTDYYNIAWIYLHRLVNFGKTTINYNIEQCHDDLQYMLMNKYNVKILLRTNNESNESNESSESNRLNHNYNMNVNGNNNRYDNLLYDSGWFRELFIELIIDDSEKIDFAIDNNDIAKIKMNKNINEIKMIKTNCRIIIDLIQILNFNEPTYVLTNIIDIIAQIKHNSDNNIIKRPFYSNVHQLLNELTLNKLPLEHILDLGLNMENIKTMMVNKDISLSKYVINCIEDMNNFDFNNTYCIFDPIKIIINDPKTIIINDKSFIVDKILCVNKNQISSEISQGNSKRIRLKYAGALNVRSENNLYYGEWLHSNIKKKIKQCNNWIPFNGNNLFKFTNYEYNNEIVIMLNNNLSYYKKIFKIRSEYFMILHDDITNDTNCTNDTNDTLYILNKINQKKNKYY